MLYRTSALLLLLVVCATGGCAAPGEGLTDGTSGAQTRTSPLHPASPGQVGDPVAVKLGMSATIARDLYVAQSNVSSIGEYGLPDKSNQGPVCSVTGISDVNGIATDRAGVLYVSSDAGPSPHEVLRFSPNCGSQLKPLTGLVERCLRRRHRREDRHGLRRFGSDGRCISQGRNQAVQRALLR